MSRADRFDSDRPRPRFDDDRYNMRGGRGRSSDPDETFERGYPRPYDDDIVRDRRYYDDEPRYTRRELAPEYERRAPPVLEREREYRRDVSPRRPAFVRRQSSLDTHDRRPLHRFYEREEYPPPARREDIYREDYRAPPYTDIPLPRTGRKELVPHRGYDDRYYEDIKVAEPDYYGDEHYRPYPDRIREREYVRDGRGHRGSPTRSYTTHSRSRRGSSPTSATTTTSRSSSSGGTTIRDEYPKKGKTRIPARLVSKRAIIDCGYPFTEEGNTIIVLKALGQDNIDVLLKLSEEYKKSEQEVAAARSSAGDIDERREEIFVPPPAAAPPPPATVVQPAPPPAPVVVPAPPPAQAPVIVNTGPARDHSPSQSTSTSSWDSYHHHDHLHADTLALAHRSRSHSRSRKEIRSEIRALERELAHRPRYHSAHGERELVKVERLENGEMVVYEQQVDVEHVPKPARIEKDKKGRLSLSVPRRY